MNKKKGIPLIKKVLVCLMTIVMVIMSASIPSLAAQPYYVIPEPCITISVAAEDTLISAIDSYTEDLQKQGYKIALREFDIKEIKNQTVKKDIASSTLEDNFIQKVLNIKIYATQVTIDTEIFYFKNSTDASAFVTKLNEQIKTEYSIIENVEIDKNKITSQDILDKKIEDAKTEKQEIEQRQREQEQKEKQKYQVTSRGSSTRRTSSSPTSAPLQSYVYISSYYGERWGRMHTGIDYAANGGTPIYAWKSGTITYRGWNGSYGNFVEIEHGDGTVSRYAHMSGYNCSLGDTVSAGETIGYVGTTGNSTGNHLHFEIKVNGNFVNPLNYL